MEHIREYLSGRKNGAVVSIGGTKNQGGIALGLLDRGGITNKEGNGKGRRVKYNKGKQNQ